MNLFGRRLKRRAQPATSTANKKRPPTANVATPAVVQTQPEAAAQPQVTAPSEVVAQPQTPAQPQATPPTEPSADSSRRFNRKIVAIAVGAALVLGTLGLATAQNSTGAPTPTPRPSAAAAASPNTGTNPPYMGSTQGCDSTFWARPDHFPAWEEYDPGQRVGSVFGHAGTYSDMSLSDTLGNQTSGEAARRALLREAVAAALNAANDSLAFPYARYDVGVGGRPAIVPTTNRFLTSGTDADILQFTSALSLANHLGCPL